jgi:transposase
MEDAYYERCAGIDVHKKMVVVCLRIGTRKEVKEFGTFTHQLREMVEWLKLNNCQMAVMESTGSYWKPLYNLFEAVELPVMVGNAQHIKNVPGRKTDVKDAEWISRLLQQGLIKPSFVPNREQRDLRDMTRFRKSQIEDRARNVNRLQKMLEGANVKLAGVLTDIQGQTSQDLLELVIGKEDITLEDVSQRMRYNIKASAEDILQSLTGTITPMQRELFKHIMSVIREQTAQIERTDEMIESHMSEAYRRAVEELDTIPGVGRISAQQIVAETGVDMSRFPTPGQFCNWSGICPGNNESAGKRLFGKTNFANQTLKTTLVQCAKAAQKNKDSFFFAQYQKLVVRRGKNRATVAVAHSMMIAIWHVLKGEQYKDLGSDYYFQFNKEKRIGDHIRYLQKLGVNLPEDVVVSATKKACTA